ncbi:MAG TPA: hypothetical protein VGL81_35520 [Polyangiaceae bacterium]|jgi:hypothetical protein
MPRSLFAAILACLGLACSPTLPPPALAPAAAESHATEQGHLLLFPQSDAESLLGRAVQKSADGSWTLADTRAPGCEVAATHEKSSFHTSRQLDAHSMTSIAGSYAKVVSLEVKFGRQNTADIDIDNTEILHGDTRGACGQLVVDTVFVGHGKRSIAADAQAAASVNLQAGATKVAPGVDTGQSQTDAISWTDDQAYAYEVRENAKSEPLDVRVSIPSIVDEGDNVTARFEAARSAWLVVYYLDGSGHADVLWPSNEEPEPRVAPDAPAILPSERERSQGIHYKATLLKPGQASRETLVVYAFADQRDFDAMKPAAGSESADGPAYAAELTKKLQSIPMSRWSRAVVAYVIKPKRLSGQGAN